MLARIWKRITPRLKGATYTNLWRLFGAQIESNVIINGYTPIIDTAGTIKIGKNLETRCIRPSYIIMRARKGADLEIGNDVFLNEGVGIVASKSIIIGSKCLIGDNVQIHDSNYHEISEDEKTNIAPISIGENVWIGRNSIINPGISIGDHSIIGAGSIVTKDVPARKIYAGNPAREISDVVASDGYRRR